MKAKNHQKNSSLPIGKGGWGIKITNLWEFKNGTLKNYRELFSYEINRANAEGRTIKESDVKNNLKRVRTLYLDSNGLAVSINGKNIIEKDCSYILAETDYRTEKMNLSTPERQNKMAILCTSNLAHARISTKWL